MLTPFDAGDFESETERHMDCVDVLSFWPGWRIEERVGMTSYSHVYKVSHEEKGCVRYGAVKRIRIPANSIELFCLDGEDIRNYVRDAASRILNAVKAMDSFRGANNIISIEDYACVDHESDPGVDIWIRTELLQGLDDYYCQRKGLSVAEVVRLGIDVSNALACCHERGILHWDMTPGAIFRNPLGCFKVDDFGIIKAIEEGTHDRLMLKGVSMHLAPEVMKGRPYGEAADVYSLGIILYRYLNGGRFPFVPVAPASVSRDDMQMDLLRRARGDKLPNPSEANPALATIILRACDADPDKRLTARELCENLREWRRCISIPVV